MPWREMSSMDARMQFVTEYRSGLFTMTELAAAYGICRRIGYKWVERYDAEGVVGLLDRSRRPHHHPHATEAALVDALVAKRKRHPRWGAKKLLAVLVREQPTAAWPSRATVCTLLKQHGLVSARRRCNPHAHTPSVLAPIVSANDVWTTDFKGEFRTGDGRYCYPLTLRDGFSRFVLRCDALTARTYVATRRRFERAFAQYGLPTRIRSDNGEPFAGTAFARVSRLSLWWMRLGIVPERIAPGHPEQNGSHEQFHAVLKAETTRPPAAHAAAQQRRFGRFCTEYNQHRPHEALGFDVPANRYEPSLRSLPSRLPAIEYPGHCEVRRVSSFGYISWACHPVFLSNALAGEDIAFEEIDDGLWTVRYASVVLGRFDERHRRIHPIATITAGGAGSAKR